MSAVNDLRRIANDMKALVAVCEEMVDALSDVLLACDDREIRQSYSSQVKARSKAIKVLSRIEGRRP